MKETGTAFSGLFGQLLVTKMHLIQKTTISEVKAAMILSKQVYRWMFLAGLNSDT